MSTKKTLKSAKAFIRAQGGTVGTDLPDPERMAADLIPLDITIPDKADTLEGLEWLLSEIQKLRQQYQEVNDYGKLNYTAYLGEKFIASQQGFERWEQRLQAAVYFVENFPESKSV